MKPNPLQIPEMRKREYPGSELTFEEELEPGVNYSKYIVSYLSDGLKIYGLLTIPNSFTDKEGDEALPLIIFNKGYVPLDEYKIDKQYMRWIDKLARASFIVFKSDYRGHGRSEGEPEGLFSPGYTVDVLNALTSLKESKILNTKYQVQIDPNKIFMIGHSMGGGITLRAMVVNPEIKAGVIFCGAVVPLSEMIERWGNINEEPGERETKQMERTRKAHRLAAQQLIEKYGMPDQDPDFWNSLSPTSYLLDLGGPIQLHHGKADDRLSFHDSEKLKEAMDQANKECELHLYETGDHNFTGEEFNLAMERTIIFLKAQS